MNDKKDKILDVDAYDNHVDVQYEIFGKKEYNASNLEELYEILKFIQEEIEGEIIDLRKEQGGYYTIKKNEIKHLNSQYDQIGKIGQTIMLVGIVLSVALITFSNILAISLILGIIGGSVLSIKKIKKTYHQNYEAITNLYQKEDNNLEEKIEFQDQISRKVSRMMFDVDYAIDNEPGLKQERREILIKTLKEIVSLFPIEEDEKAPKIKELWNPNKKNS